VEFEKNIIKLGYMEYTEIYNKIPAQFLHHKKSSTKLQIYPTWRKSLCPLNPMGVVAHRLLVTDIQVFDHNP
jgi:hypothetical protein